MITKTSIDPKYNEASRINNALSDLSTMVSDAEQSAQSELEIKGRY
jgi:hypothetical protein